MNTQTTKLGWGDRATFIGLSLTIIGFTWILHTEHKADVKRAEEWYREDKKINDERWNATNAKYEQRWADLLGKFHELDKKVK
jgi:cell division protein FtsW (lipid II flippase)